MSVPRAVPASRRRLRRACGRLPGSLRPASEAARQQEGARCRGAESSAVTVAATSVMVRVRAGTRTWADGGVRVSCAFAPWWGCPAEGPQDDGTCSDFSGFLRGWSKRVSVMRPRCRARRGCGTGAAPSRRPLATGRCRPVRPVRPVRPERPPSVGDDPAVSTQSDLHKRSFVPDVISVTVI